MANIKSSGTTTTQQVSVVSTEVHRHLQFNVQNAQDVLLVWLDSKISNNNEDCQNTFSHLQCAVSDVKAYTDCIDCIQYIETINDRIVFMLVSDSLGQHVVPRIHNLSQVDSIFIFGGNESRQEEWMKEWSKIKGIFTEIMSVCGTLRQAIQQYEQNVAPISFVGFGKRWDQLHPSFIYTQVLKEIVCTIKFDDVSLQDYVDYCREVFVDNQEELSNVAQLERRYYQQTPVWWHSCDCFLSPMLNRGLRLMDSVIVTRMGFFINDLQRHIEQLYKEQCTTQVFTVYHGQGLSSKDFEQLKQTIGGMISFNSFLSTNKVLTVPFSFAQRTATDPNLVGILFVMKIDPIQSSTPFASIRGISAVPEEDEVLFSMHSVFRIQNIKPIGANNKLYEVNLILANGNDKDLCVLTDRIQKDSFSDDQGWYRLGSVLYRMRQYDKAEEIYEILLDQTAEEIESASIYNQLASIKNDQEKYREALMFYDKSLVIKEKLLPPNHPSVAMSYNNVGVVYKNMSDNSKAISFHEKAVAIRQKSLPADHPDLAMSYNNIGVVYQNMGDYTKALLFYDKALEIWQQVLPLNHPELAMCYNNIGVVYKNLGDYTKALLYYDKALTIRQQALPADYPQLAVTHNNIGLLYENMNYNSKARSFYESAVQLGKQLLPTNHPHLQTYEINLERIKKKL